MAKRALCLPRIAFHRTEFAGADVADGVARDCDAARAADAPPALRRLLLLGQFDLLLLVLIAPPQVPNRLA